VAGAVVTKFATIRQAIYDQLVLHNVSGGALEDVVIRRGMPTNYADLYGTARGSLDLLWIGATSGNVDRYSFPQNGMCLRETFDVDVMIQVDRAADTGTQGTVEARAEALGGYVFGILASDPHVGLTIASEGIDALVVKPSRFAFEVAALDSGGREPGHVSALAVTASASVTANHVAPALP